MPAWLSASLTRPVLVGAEPLPETVHAHFDGGCLPRNPGGIATLGWAVFAGEGRLTKPGEPLRQFTAVLADGGPRATNNWAEWSSFGTLLRYLTETPQVRRIAIFGDSKLVVSQFTGGWRCKAPHLIRLRQRATVLARAYAARQGKLRVTHVYREWNAPADMLTELAYEEYVKSIGKPWLIGVAAGVRMRWASGEKYVSSG